MEYNESRREELPSSTEAKELDTLQANVEYIKKWRALNPTLARWLKIVRGIPMLVSTISSNRNGDKKAQLREM